jgi:hypothetical protein
MATPLPSHLGALREGFTLLRRHPALSLGLALLATALSQLGPALELVAKVGPSPINQLIFGMVGLLPMTMYFHPWLQARLDAETLNLPGNPTATWQATFDTRWLRTFLVVLGLGVTVGLGLTLFVLPGIILLTLFGWAPLRVLLRGDDLLSSLRWSQAAMARHWPRVVQAVLAIALVVLVYMTFAGLIMNKLLPSLDSDQVPAALLRLKHPSFWVFNLLNSLMNLWMSCALLALYQRLEASLQNPVSS